mgnify:CR=1 FL=1
MPGFHRRRRDLHPLFQQDDQDIKEQEQVLFKQIAHRLDRTDDPGICTLIDTGRQEQDLLRLR